MTKVVDIETRKQNKKAVNLNPLTFGTSMEDAEKIRKANNPNDYYNAILTVEEITGLEIPEKRFLLRGLIAEHTINIINGYRGSGKSWLALAITNAVSSGEDLGPWKIEHSVNTLIVDGEMSLGDTQRRLALLNYRRQERLSELYLYCEAYAYRLGLHRANILEPEWRDAISANVTSLGIQLLILDNLSSLAPGIDENSKLDFDPVNRWLLELRFSGVTIVLTHHTGKNGEQRGTSAHEDHTDMCYLICKTDLDKPGCIFDLKVTKDRAKIATSMCTRMHLSDTDDGKLELIPDFRHGIKGAMQLLDIYPTISWETAVNFGVSKATYFRAKDKSSKRQKVPSEGVEKEDALETDL